MDLDEPALKGRNKVAQYVEQRGAAVRHAARKCWVTVKRKLIPYAVG